MVPVRGLPHLTPPSDSMPREAMRAVAELLRGRSPAEWKGGALGAGGSSSSSSFGASPGLAEDMALLKRLVRVAMQEG